MTPPRLLEQVRAEIRARHYGRWTEDAYIHWIRRFIVFHGRRHPRELGAPEISSFLTWLAVEQRAAASTQNQALSGVLSLYRDVLRQEIGRVELCRGRERRRRCLGANTDGSMAKQDPASER